MSLDALKSALPPYAKDLKLNLGSVIGTSELPEQTLWGTVLAVAVAAGSPIALRELEPEAKARLSPQAYTAAKSAAAVMAMNNVYYRFVHLVANPEYGKMPARLRMNFIGSHGIAKDEFELMSLAVSAMNGCGMCIDSHERVLLEHGVKPDVIQSAVRIAAVMKALATVHATL